MPYKIFYSSQNIHSEVPALSIQTIAPTHLLHPTMVLHSMFHYPMDLMDFPYP